jgi:hypothetical protein
MKSLRTLLFLSILLAGCAKDDDPTPEPAPYAGIRKIALSETTGDNLTKSTRTQSYLFDEDGLLSSSSIKVEEFLTIDPTPFDTRETISSVTRPAVNEVVITTESVSTATYTLGDDGFASSCLYREGSSERNYSFTYITTSEGSALLHTLTESIKGTETTSLTFSYSPTTDTAPTGYQTELTVNTRGKEFTYLLQTGEIVSTDAGEVPCLFLADLYPLNFHRAALYGKLLGNQLPYYVATVKPKGSNDGEIKYTYTRDNTTGRVTSCSEQSVSGNSSSYRTIKYEVEYKAFSL